MARKGRTLMVAISIFIGVFGVTMMVSITDLINCQLAEDLDSADISHAHVYVRATGGRMSLEDNRAVLAQLGTLPDVVDVEGQAVYAVGWQESGAAADGFEDGTLIAFTEPFGEANLEPIVRVTKGRYPRPGAGEIAVEQRFADEQGVALGDTLVFDQPDGSSAAWKIVGFVLHPYFTIDPARRDQIQPFTAIYANYADAQQIAGFAGLSAIHVRYTDNAAAEAGQDALNRAIVQQTSYVTSFTFIDDPEENYIFTLINDITGTLSMLGALAMIIPAFLVANVINTIVVEQRKQIGALKVIGASTWDNFVMYAGLALAYGVIGRLPGLIMAAPVAGVLARMIASMAFTYLDGIQFSVTGLITGLAMGLLVPVLAALIPVLNGMRISIFEAMTDLGIASNWGQSRISRWIGSLPLPVTLVQAISNLYRKKGRLVLTGLALTFAAAAFMGITAVYGTLSDYVDDMFNLYNYEIIVAPQNPEQSTRIRELAVDVDGVEAAYLGYSASVGVEGFVSSDPLTEGSNQVTVTGVDPATPTITFDWRVGTGWQDDPTRDGIIVSRTVAENVNRSLGDSLTLIIGGQAYAFPIIGVSESGFDALYMDWRVLAELTDFVDAAGQPLPGQVYVQMVGHPSVDDVDAMIDVITDRLSADGIQAAYINQPFIAETQAQQIDLFGMMFNITSGIMALVGAIGLMATLSMAVFERQKEIGVMRSVGAGSLTILSQFLAEGVLVGMGAWLVAVPLSVALGYSFITVLPFDFVDFVYSPQVLGLGFVGIVLVAAVASLWPSMAATRKTVADILRYQ